ncbi:type I-E CRISPR-associated protein Cse1/CasA [Nonomuraea bangladeshensis]|uniref:Type I-E CRISPR-associated protein Cse1/CasA n=1 Tax=Nonomuraea bangladeshensis TaxID=404385 RepID=A0ABV3H8Q1_9ACTN
MEVVLFRASQDGRAVPVSGGDPVDMTAPDPPDEDVLRRLLAAAVPLTASADIPEEVVQAVAVTPVPALFRSSPWLYEHRALLLAGERCTVGGHTLRYREDLGFLLEGAEEESPLGSPSSFDLLTQPWIPVVGLDGRATAKGLADVIAEAHTIRRIAAEAPTMTAALHRLLLAVFHRAYGPPNEKVWQDLWEAEKIPAGPLGRYLERYRDRFDLFHPEVPFMQCVELRSLTPATAAKLVPYRAVGNNVTLFDHTTSADTVVLTPQEAARWLVTLQAFDPGGMKTPYEKDKSSERAPCNWFGVVLVEGRNLKETILLNALVYLPDYEKPRMTTPDDRPVWEEPTGPSPRPDKRTVRGWTDLLTWPSRRVLLSTTGSGTSRVVDGVVITPGTRLDAQLPDEELMAAFRRPTDAKGRFKREAPMLPVRLNPLRGIWRHSIELLLTDVWQEGVNRQRPAALDQIAELAGNKYIPANAVYTLRVFGQHLDSKATVIETWLEEEVPAPVPLLRARDESLGALIGCAISLADEAGSGLRSFQAEYRREFRDQPVSDIDRGYWPRLSRPFGAFLVDLGRARAVGRSEESATRAWGRYVIETAMAAANRWVAGSPAEGRAMIVLGKHHAVFEARLRKAERVFQAQIKAYTAGSEQLDV